jgi:hypothetical protein
MSYQILHVTYHLDNFLVHRDDKEPDVFSDLSDLLNHYAGQGLEYVNCLPTEWRWLKESDLPHGPIETKGLRLDQLQLIFRERDD